MEVLKEREQFQEAERRKMFWKRAITRRMHQHGHNGVTEAWRPDQGGKMRSSLPEDMVCAAGMGAAWGISNRDLIRF